MNRVRCSSEWTPDCGLLAEAVSPAGPDLLNSKDQSQLPEAWLLKDFKLLRQRLNFCRRERFHTAPLGGRMQMLNHGPLRSQRLVGTSSRLKVSTSAAGILRNRVNASSAFTRSY